MNYKVLEPQLTEYLHRRAGKNGVPLSGTFELSPICNMDCRMCYVKMTPEEVRNSGRSLRTATEWLSLAEEAKNMGMLYLLLTGGEPFLWPEFRELYTGLKKMGLVITINTNATLINREIADWLKQDPPSRINITLYGASDATYERLCGNPHGFSQVDQAIEMLLEAGISVKINCSVTPYNKDDLEAILAYGEQKNLIVQAVSYMFPPMRRNEALIGWNDRFSPEEAAEQMAKIAYLQKGEEWFCRHVQALRKGEAAVSEQEEDCMVVEGETLRCRAGFSSFWVTWDGRLLPCGMMNEPAENPFSDTFQAAWKKIREKTGQLRLPPACAACSRKEVCRTCAAMVVTETGGLSEKPMYRCQMLDAYLPACETLLEKQKNRRVSDEK